VALGWRLEELLLAIEQAGDVVGGQLEAVAVGDGIGRTGFHTVAAEDTPRIVDVIHLGVPLAGADAVLGGVLRRLDVDALRRASSRTQKTGHTLLEPVLVPLQDVQSAVAHLKMNRLVGIILRHRRPEQILQRDRKALGEGNSGLSDFP
jgi:hypothetical protein